MTAFLMAVAFLAGIWLGAVYFSGLWLTVRRLPRSRYPVLLLLASYVGRMALVLFGFYIVMDGYWERAAACLAGFLLARALVLRRWRPERVRAESLAEGGAHRWN